MLRCLDGAGRLPDGIGVQSVAGETAHQIEPVGVARVAPVHSEGSFPQVH